MVWLRLFFLAVVLTSVSGYRFRCWWMCTDQTGIQNDYIEQRDRCREYAQLKLDMSMRTPGPAADEKGKKGKLVSLFSECMANNGWNVSDSKPTKPEDPGVAAAAVTASAAATAGPLVSPPPADPALDKAALSRSSECAFARHAAGHSSIAAARASACDIECAERLKAAPDAPRPAACTSGPGPDLSTGVEREN